jgi:hypothetical protein
MQIVLDYNMDKRVSIDDFETSAIKYLRLHMQLQHKFSASIADKK